MTGPDHPRPDDGRSSGEPPTGPSASPDDGAADDPVLVRRAAMQRFSEIGQRIGYSLFGLAVVLFFVGFPTGFPTWLVTSIVGCLVVGSLVLAPAIVIGYGVKAAVREDHGLDSGH